MANLVRSPYYISASLSGALSVLVSLRIWNGDKSSPIATPQYTLLKNTVDNSALFEVAELIRDYLSITFDGGYSCEAVWVQVGITFYNGLNGTGSTMTGGGSTTYLFTDGYGYFEEGKNPTANNLIMLDNSVIWRPEDENIRIPVLCQEEAAEVVMVSKGEVVRTESLTASTIASDCIKYASVSGEISADNYKQRVLSTGGTFENNPLLWDIDNYVDINLVDEIRVYRNDNYEKVTVRTHHCDKYPDRKVTFVNKNGAFQDVYFFARETESITTSSERYKSNVINAQTGAYSTTAHQYQLYNKQAKERITLNTGFVSEDYNEVIKQLLMSEQVWLTRTTDTESKIYPVMPATSDVTMRTSLNDKMVNYEIEFEYAFDKVQNIR